MERIKLNDGTILNIEGGSTENSVSVVVDTLDTLNTYVEAFTEENLTRFEILNDADLVTAVITDKYLASFTGTPVRETENYTLMFNFGNVDTVSARLDALEEEQEIQDEAIQELAETLAE